MYAFSDDVWEPVMGYPCCNFIFVLCLKDCFAFSLDFSAEGTTKVLANQQALGINKNHQPNTRVMDKSICGTKPQEL